MTDKPVELQMGFWPARQPKDKPKREPIGFVHFGPPEEERKPPVIVTPYEKVKQEDRADE
jgi:hypothetical protein